MQELIIHTDPAVPSIDSLVNLLRGSSDPFDSFAIAITPEVNRFISFVRDAAIPCTYFNNMFRGLSSGVTAKASVLERSTFISAPGALRDWQQMKESLNDECAGLARLAGYASMMAQVSRGDNWARLASLRMRERSTRLLRLLLEQSNSMTEKTTADCLPHLYGLFRAECFDGNVTAAAYHARVLRAVFERGNFTMQLLTQVLYNDVDLAIKRTKRTLIDVDSWCPRVLNGPLTKIRESIPILQAEQDHDLHSNITYQPLQNLWLRRKLVVKSVYEKPFPLAIGTNVRSAIWLLHTLRLRASLTSGS